MALHVRTMEIWETAWENRDGADRAAVLIYACRGARVRIVPRPFGVRLNLGYRCTQLLIHRGSDGSGVVVWRRSGKERL